LDVCVVRAAKFPGDGGVVNGVNGVVDDVPGVGFGRVFVVIVDAAEGAVEGGFEGGDVCAFVTYVDLEFLTELDFCATIVGESVVETFGYCDCDAITRFYNILHALE
jgi:hypothetical protein